MNIDLSGISPWIWLISGLVIAFVVLRFFSHIVVRILHFIFRFFWHGCLGVVLLALTYFILRALGVL